MSANKIVPVDKSLQSYLFVLFGCNGETVVVLLEFDVELLDSSFKMS